MQVEPLLHLQYRRACAAQCQGRGQATRRAGSGPAAAGVTCQQRQSGIAENGLQVLLGVTWPVSARPNSSAGQLRTAILQLAASKTPDGSVPAKKLISGIHWFRNSQQPVQLQHFRCRMSPGLQRSGGGR